MKNDWCDRCGSTQAVEKLRVQRADISHTVRACVVCIEGSPLREWLPGKSGRRRPRRRVVTLEKVEEVATRGTP
jgi:hypothetical protein